MTRAWIGLPALASVVVLAAAAQAQDPPEPQLQALGGTFECSVLQTAEGDVLQLTCTETDSPLAESFDFEVYQVRRPRYSSNRISIGVRANVAIADLRLEVVFRHTGSSYVNRELAWERGIAAGESWSESVYPDSDWTHVDINPAPGYQGWECRGCGTFVFADIPISSFVDPSSIRPEDAARFLREMQDVVMPRR